MQREQEHATAAGPGPAGDETSPDLRGAYPRLDEDQIARLEAEGTRRPTSTGEVLYAAGARYDELLVILEGTVAVVGDDHAGSGERVIGVHGRGRFLGEIGVFTGQAAFVSAVVRRPGAVLAVGADRLRALVERDPDLGDVIMCALIMRRSLLFQMGSGLRVIGSRFSADTRRLREFLARNRVPHAWIDLERDPGAEALLQQLHVPPEDTPVVIWQGERVLRNPGNAELARLIGLAPPPSESVRVCDLVVIGAGPAGLAASVYGASEGLDTVAVDGVATGGQAGTSSRIENYLGFPAGISGPELAERAVVQAERFGARIGVPATATALDTDGSAHVVRMDDGSTVTARAVVIATGARYRRLDVPGLERFEGAGVYYAATWVEARICAGDPVAVVGGGNSAGQAALFLARHAARVRLLILHDDLGRDMSRYLVDRIARDPVIAVMTSTEVVGVGGEQGLERLLVRHVGNGDQDEILARALFVFIGVRPNVGWLADQLQLDDRGFIVTGAGGGTDREPSGAEPLPLETSRPGVFAAGDVRSGSIKRVASAVGEGAMVVRFVHDHLERIGWAGHDDVPS
jgi:thioredoxin reductase (NADPH)